MVLFRVENCAGCRGQAGVGQKRWVNAYRYRSHDVTYAGRNILAGCGGIECMWALGVGVTSGTGQLGNWATERHAPHSGVC